MCRLLSLDEMDVPVRATFVLAGDMSRTLHELASEGMAAAVANLQLCAFVWHIVLSVISQCLSQLCTMGILRMSELLTIPLEA